MSVPILGPRDDVARMAERAGIQLAMHEPVRWKARYTIEKYWGEYDPLKTPYEVIDREGNLLLTAGIQALWNGLVTAGLGTPFNSTNAQIVVGDGSTAPAVGNTDMAAALATKINAADATSASNATPIVVAGTYSPTPVVGEVYALSGFGGAGAAAINNTFELSVASAASITLLNSAGTGAITVAGGVIQKVNKYRQLVNGAPVVSTNQVVFVAVFGTANANFAWNEWGVCTGGGATNKQAVAPPTLLNRAAPGGGLGTKTSAAAWTFTVTLSLS